MGMRNGLPGRWLSLALVCGVALLALAGRLWRQFDEFKQ